MKDELKVYKEILEAIKIAESNMDLETDMNEVEINKKDLKKKLLKDSDIQNIAKEKVKKNE